MYFSNNITYFYEPIDENKPELGRRFVTLNDYAQIKENEEINRFKNEEIKRQKFIDSLDKTEFTEEELEFLKQNWFPS